jgi:hypothetical protein
VHINKNGIERGNSSYVRSAVFGNVIHYNSYSEYVETRDCNRSLRTTAVFVNSLLVGTTTKMTCFGC